MLVKSNCRTPFLGLPAGNCDFLKEITLFRYSPFFCSIKNCPLISLHYSLTVSKIITNNIAATIARCDYSCLPLLWIMVSLPDASQRKQLPA